MSDLAGILSAVRKALAKSPTSKHAVAPAKAPEHIKQFLDDNDDGSEYISNPPAAHTQTAGAALLSLSRKGSVDGRLEQIRARIEANLTQTRCDERAKDLIGAFTLARESIAEAVGTDAPASGELVAGDRPAACDQERFGALTITSLQTPTPARKPVADAASSDTEQAVELALMRNRVKQLEDELNALRRSTARAESRPAILDHALIHDMSPDPDYKLLQEDRPLAEDLRDFESSLRNARSAEQLASLHSSAVFRGSVGGSGRIPVLSGSACEQSTLSSRLAKLPPILNLEDFERQWEAIESENNFDLSRLERIEDAMHSSLSDRADTMRRRFGHTSTQRAIDSIFAARPESLHNRRSLILPDAVMSDAPGVQTPSRLSSRPHLAVDITVNQPTVAPSNVEARASDPAICPFANLQPVPVNKIALPGPGAISEALAVRSLAFDPNPAEPCIVWSRETSLGLVPSGAIALSHVKSVYFGDSARDFRGRLLALRRGGCDDEIMSILADEDMLHGAGDSTAGSPYSIVLTCTSRVLCFEFLEQTDFAEWIRLLTEAMQ